MSQTEDIACDIFVLDARRYVIFMVDAKIACVEKALVKCGCADMIYLVDLCSLTSRSSSQ